MKGNWKSLVVAACLVVALAGACLAAGQAYVIGAGDMISISVWKDQSMSRQLVVLPDGFITFPLIGRLKAEGKTLDQLESEVTRKLGRYISKPVVTVEVLQVNSMQIYVIGKVNRPGRFALSDEVDVLQALAMAGGFNTFARRSKVRIFRKVEGKTTILPFDYDAVADGKRLEQNVYLQRGDVVVVP